MSPVVQRDHRAAVYTASPMTIRLEPPSLKWSAQFLSGVERSRDLHRGLVTPPRTREELRRYLARFRRPTHLGHFVCLATNELAGVVNVSEIVRGFFQSAYLGYYAFAPHDGRGHMTEGLRLVIARAFGAYKLHRLEANIQPENARSIALVRRLGFRLEGMSPRYLKVAGRWRDHERWALTMEEWRTGR
jgi:ribosomal-protein-alanine N-acetyltransferase